MKKIIFYMGFIAICGLQGMKRTPPQGGEPSSQPIEQERSRRRTEGGDVQEQDNKKIIPGTQRYLDLNEIDSIEQESLAEMLANTEEFPQGIDIVETMTIDNATNTPYHHYLYAPGLRRYMYTGRDTHPVNRLPLNRQFMRPFHIQSVDSELTPISLDLVIPAGGNNALYEIALGLQRGDIGNRSRQDYQRAADYYQELIKNQQAPQDTRAAAQFDLATMYVNGQIGSNRPEDYQKAATLYGEVIANQQASQDARAKARVNLANMYVNGLIGSKRPEDYQQAATLYGEVIANQQASQDARAKARISLAIMYVNGLIGSKRPEDYQQAATLYGEVIANQQAPQDIRARAQLNLATMYVNGRIGSKRPEDYQQAATLYGEVIANQQAPQDARARAQFNLATMYVNGQIGSNRPEDYQQAATLYGEVIANQQVPQEVRDRARELYWAIYNIQGYLPIPN